MTYFERLFPLVLRKPQAQANWHEYGCRYRQGLRESPPPS